MDGAFRQGLALGDATPRDRAPGGLGARLRHTGIVEPVRELSVQMILGDRLRRTDPLELRWTIGSHDDHRNTGEIGFDDCGMEMSGGRPTGTHDETGATRTQSGTEGGEGG